jgi:hypothetical protein
MSNLSIIIFFILTASLGITLLVLVLQNKRRPIYIVAIHGIFAMASYGLLTFNVADKADRFVEEWPLESYAFVFFSFAILGGIYMLVRDKILKLGIKKWMPFVHGGLAAIGLIILIVATIKR